MFFVRGMGFNKFIIDTNALKSNAVKIRNVIGDNVKFCGVVKANAYGHGSVIVANRLKDICDFFAVANVIEAMELRDRNITNNILILGIVPMTDIKYCIFNNISLTISSLSPLSPPPIPAPAETDPEAMLLATT